MLSLMLPAPKKRYLPPNSPAAHKISVGSQLISQDSLPSQSSPNHCHYHQPIPKSPSRSVHTNYTASAQEADPTETESPTAIPSKAPLFSGSTAFPTIFRLERGRSPSPGESIR